MSELGMDEMVHQIDVVSASRVAGGSFDCDVLTCVGLGGELTSGGISMISIYQTNDCIHSDLNRFPW